MDDQPSLTASPFDAIRRVDDQGNEYWSARDLAKLLGYREYRFFKNAIQKLKKLVNKADRPLPIISCIRTV